jgi:hydroxymethylpyrimidine kinase/phosphomethylpyrimidine kinase
MTPPVVLTIAGSDSGGGAGIQADLKTFAALQAYGASVVTAVTAQNTTGVSGVCNLPPEFVEAQLDAVLEDLPVLATKVGMLGGAEIADVVLARARAGRLPNLVLDPVLTSSSGRRLGTPAMIERLLPYAKVVTPNRDEASELVGWRVRNGDEMARAAEQIGARGPGTVVITGSGDTPDVVWSSRGTWMVTGPKVDTYNDHGTGCTFSAAIAVRLALGEQVAVAVESAKRYVARALAGGRDWKLGRGPGPLNHFGW